MQTEMKLGRSDVESTFESGFDNFTKEVSNSVKIKGKENYSVNSEEWSGDCAGNQSSFRMQSGGIERQNASTRGRDGGFHRFRVDLKNVSPVRSISRRSRDRCLNSRAIRDAREDTCTREKRAHKRTEIAR